MALTPKPLKETNITAAVKDGVLTITCPLPKKPGRSSGGTGPNYLVASTRGNRITDIEFGGKKMLLTLNAYYPAT